jgi:two-component system cell cycle sensor histidine kinase/response regulator CckA
MTLHILHFEDNPADARLVQICLADANIAAEIVVVAKPDDYFVALEKGGFDVILSDVSLPGFTATEALMEAKRKWAHIPFIVLSGGEGELAGAMYRNAGALDYVCKQDLSKLVQMIQQLSKKLK